VSVVVPVWDREHLLGACLDSILAQTLAPLEVIVVDDGSSDASAAVAEARPDVRVMRRAHEGPAAARNAGLAVVTGELVALCDSDDLWHERKLERQVAHLQANPHCDVVLCRHETIFDEGVEQPDWLRPDAVYGDLDGVSTSSGLFRREALDGVTYRDDIGLGEGFDVLVQVRRAGRVIEVLDDKLWSRRIHGNSLMDARNPEAKTGMLQSVRSHLRDRRASEG
jgi:glycosyltransferase involved in cell wall biosynthesis